MIFAATGVQYSNSIARFVSTLLFSMSDKFLSSFNPPNYVSERAGNNRSLHQCKKERKNSQLLDTVRQIKAFVVTGS